MELVLEPGDKLTVTLKGTDGEFTFEWGKKSLRLTSDLNDTSGRGGVIYEEVFSRPDRREKDLTRADVKRDKTKLLPTRPGRDAHLHFVNTSQFLARRPTEAAAYGNLPDSGSLATLPSNTILVLFEGRLPNSGMPSHVKHTFVKSVGRWWPAPDTEPHNCYDARDVYELMQKYSYGYALYVPA